MILTVIDNIPLYSTIREAVSWGRRNNIQGYHTHTYNRRLGYMAGTNHSIFVNTPATPRPSNVVTPRVPIIAATVVTTPTPTQTPTQTTTQTTTPPIGGSGGGY